MRDHKNPNYPDMRDYDDGCSGLFDGIDAATTLVAGFVAGAWAMIVAGLLASWLLF